VLVDLICLHFHAKVDDLCKSRAYALNVLTLGHITCKQDWQDEQNFS
jgi:hypothetical protein